MLLASLLIASFVIFAAVYLAPGNPISALSGGRALPASSIRVLEARYHLNEPFFAQYWYWLTNALHGNLGISITLRENVSTLIAQRVWTTAGLVLYASRADPAVRDRHGHRVRPAARVPGHQHAGGDRGLGGDPRVRRRDRADPAVLGEARLVPGPRQRHRLPRATCGTSRCPRSPWRSRRSPSWPGSPGPSIREESRPRARADRGQPRHPGPPADPAARPAQRRDPDHHDHRHHDRLADRAGGRGRDGVQPERPRRLPGPGGRSPRTSRSCRASRWCWSPRSSWSTCVVDLLYAVLDPRVSLGSRAQ